MLNVHRKVLAVVGGGDSACEEALFLTRYASRVHLLVRRDVLRASKTMAERALASPKITVEWNTVPVEAKGDGKLLSSLALSDTKTGAKRDLAVKGLFYAIGHEPNTSLLKNNDKGESPIHLDSTGYILVKPGTTLTNVDGVFACGDVQDKR